MQITTPPEDGRGLIFMTANPFHYGHLGLIEETLSKCRTGCNIYLGNRAKNWTLPHQVRISALKNALSNHKLTESVSVIFNTNERTGSILEIPSENYDLLAMGSDIANSINPTSGRLREYERE